ncbi:uncharacterized protein LOC144921091 [Branchiostoma floridae x Branchiostoma belcheri]
MADDNPEVKCSPNTCNELTTNAAVRDQENMEVDQNGHQEENEGKNWELTQTDKLNKSLLTSFLDRLNQQEAPFPQQTAEEDERFGTSGPEEQEFEDCAPSQDIPPLVRNTGPVQNDS